MATVREREYFFPAVGRSLEGVEHLAYPLMRIATGLMFVPHGAQKLFGWFGGNTQATAAFFSKLGIEPALPRSPIWSASSNSSAGWASRSDFLPGSGRSAARSCWPWRCSRCIL